MSDLENNPIGLSAAELAALDDDATDTSTTPVEQDEVMRAELSNSAVMALAGEVTPPEHLEQAIQQLRRDREDLETAYEEGESDLTYAEQRARVREIDAEIMSLSGDLAESRLISRVAGQAAQEDWKRQIASARKEAKSMGLDLRPGSEMEAQWDRCVKFLGNDPANSHQSASWFLKTALEMVASRHDKLDASRYPKGGRVSAPRGLDGLSGLALERALARLSPEEAERWLTT